MGLIYRGVPPNTRRAQEALNGIVRPRGTSQNYTAHVLGEDVETDVTSWTRRVEVASKFAGRSGIILQIDEASVQHQVVPHPLPNRYPEEEEVLVRGELSGVQRFK